MSTSKRKKTVHYTVTLTIAARYADDHPDLRPLAMTLDDSPKVCHSRAEFLKLAAREWDFVSRDVRDGEEMLRAEKAEARRPAE